ncbi:MAG: hypothetical protein IJY28_03705 [Clostridia bacterium]|nr:hypothetical protein [Clostridia bacterium]
MKYIDRIRIGLELYMDRLSPLTSRINTRPPEKAAELLMAEDYPDLHAECRRIHDGLRRLISGDFDLAEPLTQRVVAIARSPYTPTPERLVPLFRWVQALRESNRLARERGLNELKYCCDGTNTAEILQSFSEISAQRISLIPADDALTLSIPSSLWGDVSLRFTGIPSGQLPDAPRFGYLFWVEGERTGQDLRFRLLLDEAFFDTDYQERLLQTNDWAELEFTCKDVQATVRTYDYTTQAHRHGFSGYNAMILCFGELLRKYFTLGQTALSGGELRLIPPAMLFYRLEMIPNAYVLNDHLPPATQLFEQHYQLRQMITYFDRECGQPGQQIARLLEEASNCYADDDSGGCQKSLEQLRRYLHLLLELNDIVAVTQPILAALREATAAYTDRPPFADHYDRMRAFLEERVVPLLTEAGFTGTFPHYYRAQQPQVWFISFLSDFLPSPVPGGGLMCNVSIAAASCLTEEEHRLDGFPFHHFGASDFIESKCPGYFFGRVCSLLQDGVHCGFRILEDDAFDLPPSWETTAAELANGVERALCSLNGIPLPKNPPPHTRAFLKRNHIFAELFNRSLLLGLPVAAILMFWQWDFATALPTLMLMTIAALGIGLLVVLLVTLFRYFRFRRYIWHR